MRLGLPKLGLHAAANSMADVLFLSIARRWKTGGVELGDIVILRLRVDHRVLEVRNLPIAVALDHRK
jgi:hypothetical protein